ncbi:MAG TPA: ribonuclease J [Chroococcales cyanobacterium]
MEKKVQVIPLGGLGEIGKNMWVVRTEEDMVILDCGFAFPSEEMYGIDIVLPDFSYVINNAHLVRGIVLSHGHEDHIGALPFLLKQLNVPVYGTPLTLGLVETKLSEYGGLKGKVQLNCIHPRERLELGSISIEFMRVCHSIADGVGMAVHTPAGVIIYTGDFKLDQTPIDGETFDYFKFAEYGEEGVLLLLSDSTNAENEGFTPSERLVGEALDSVFIKAQKRIIVSTFASNIHRIQQVLNIAAKYGRKVAIIGRSMQKVSEQAHKLGYMDFPPDTVVRVDALADLPHEQTVIVTTGSQGEPMSGLARMASQDHKHINVVSGDTIIISAVPIPGNEKFVQKTINKLFSRGAEVIYEEDHVQGRASQHVSGHASQEELKIMLTLTRPSFFVPVHGEYRHLVHHSKLAANVGVSPDHILIAENGDVIELTPTSMRIAGKVPAAPVMIDGALLRDIGHNVLKDRKQLAMEGVLSVAVTVDNEGHLLGGPDLMSQGFVYSSEMQILTDDIKEAVVETIMREREKPDNLPIEAAFLRKVIQEDLAKFLYERTRRRPVIMPLLQVI